MSWNYLSIHKLQLCNRWSLGMDKLFYSTLHCACDYLPMLGLKSNHTRQRGPRVSMASPELSWKMSLYHCRWVFVCATFDKPIECFRCTKKKRFKPLSFDNPYSGSELALPEFTVHFRSRVLSLPEYQILFLDHYRNNTGFAIVPAKL